MGGAPVLQVLTRCFRRPSMLVRNLASVAALGAGVEHTLLVDTLGRGVGASYEALATVPVRGQYIWILDDDDICIFPGLLTELRRLAAKRVDVVVVRMDHGELGVLPDDAHWRAAPELGKIGCSACIVRREVWMEARAVFVPGAYTSDFAFAAFLLDTEARRDGATEKGGYEVEWLDVVASRVQRRSLGAAE
jgi:hypothetical protein